MNDSVSDVGPVRLNVSALPGLMARTYGDQAAALMNVAVLVEVDRAAFPSVPVGELLAQRLAACGVAELVALISESWPHLRAASETDPCVVEVLELVCDWADHLLGQAMTAARLIKGGECDGAVAA